VRGRGIGEKTTLKKQTEFQERGFKGGDEEGQCKKERAEKRWKIYWERK